MRKFIARISFLRDQRGALLAEALVSIAVFTLLGSAVMTGVSATSAAALGIRTMSTADTLASNQLFEILADPYEEPPHVYTPIDTPPGFSITAEAQVFIVGDPNIAKIVIVVFKDGEPIKTLESLRLKESS